MGAVRAAAHLAKPPKWATVLEVRAIAERAAMDAAMPLLERLPNGDGQTCLLYTSPSPRD